MMRTSMRITRLADNVLLRVIAYYVVLAAVVVLLARALPDAARAQEVAAGDRDAAPPLFASDSVFELVLRTDLRALLHNRDSLSDYRPASLAYIDAPGARVTLPAGVKARGHFRRQRRNCQFPPVRVRLAHGTKGTIFATQKQLKLATPCWAGRREYEQYVLEEYLLHRVYNLLTPVSFRVRLIHITYEDTTAEPLSPVATYAFFLEDDDAMAARNGGKILKAQNATRDDLDARHADLVALFEYLIGNTDWSVPALHNIRLVQTSNGHVYPVPYDFDFAGAIDMPYATPDPALPIKSVRQRLFRGYCASPADLAPVVALFNERRAAIYALYDSLPALDRKLADRTRRYFDQFYDTINDAGKLKRVVAQSCSE
jgi:hypothetical protein